MGKLSDTLNLARERAEALNRPYQGELTPQEAYTLLQEQGHMLFGVERFE